MEANALVHSVYVGVATVLGDLGGVLEVEPWAFGSKVHAAVGVGGPAVETTVPVVVRVLVGNVLNAEHSFLVKPVLALENRGPVAGNHVVAHDMAEGIAGNENLYKWSIMLKFLRKPKREE